MGKDSTGDPNYQKIADGIDMEAPVDDAFREKLINELRTFPNIFVICGDSEAASHTIQVGTKEADLLRAFVSIMKKYPNVKEFLELCLKNSQ